MLRSLAKFSESEASNHAPSLADFITTMVGFKVFSTHRRRARKKQTIGHGGYGPMSEMGHFRRFDDVRVESAYPPIATTERTSRHVSNVPIPELACPIRLLRQRARAERSALRGRALWRS